MFLDLTRAMNGLRVASKAWLGTCSQILMDNAGLVTRPSEQTILAGMSKPSECPTAVLVYVDSSVAVLTDEAASRYRKLVGKLAWWAQSRPDHARSSRTHQHP